MANLTAEEQAKIVRLGQLATYDTKIKEYIGTKITESAYDDSTLSGKVTANENAIALLNNTDATKEGTVAKAVADGIATVVANAPADFDTLKEVADWIANDTTGAARMQIDISNLRTNVGNKKTAAVMGEDGVTVVTPATDASGIYKDIDDINTKINGLIGEGGEGSLGDLAYLDKVTDTVIDDAAISSSKINGLDSKLTAIETAIGKDGEALKGVAGQITSAIEALDATKDGSYTNGIKVTVAEVDGKIDSVTVEDAGLAEKIASDIKTNAKDATYAGEITLAQAIASKVNAEDGKGLSTNDYDATEKEKVKTSAEALVALAKDKTNEGSIDNRIYKQAKDAIYAEATEGENATPEVTIAQAIKANADAIASLTGGEEGSLGSLAYKSTISNADVAADAAIAQSKIEGLTDSLAGKVDVVEGKGLSTNDYDAAAKAAVDSLATTYEAKGTAAGLIGTIPTSVGETATSTVIAYVDAKCGAVEGSLSYAANSDIDALFA